MGQTAFYRLLDQLKQLDDEQKKIVLDTLRHVETTRVYCHTSIITDEELDLLLDSDNSCETAYSLNNISADK
uniref:hypothetical protein n=1 Tax=Thaumasiovibrio occultus TaxID=1891184 RepID=UPI000B3570CD|nr:hypothetical protein [Thaumasiovibrio occultus]